MQDAVQQNLSRIADLEKERDFYFQKLRDVEGICQEPDNESLPHVQKIVEILYATEVSKRILFNHFSFAPPLSYPNETLGIVFQGRF